MPSRRAVLAVSGAALTSGCFLLPGCRWGTTLRATPVDEIDLYVAEPTGPRRSLVETARQQGSVEVAVTHDLRPFRDGRIVERDGTYYEVRLAETSETEIPALVVNARIREDDESIDDADVLAFDSLPRTDRAALRTLILGPEHQFVEYDGPPQSGRFTATDSPIPYPDGIEHSRLREAGESWVEWGDQQYHVDVLRDGTMTQQSLRYELAAIGTSREAVRNHVIPDDPIQFDDLSEEERAVMDEAIDGEYETCEERPPEFQAIVDRLERADGSHGHTPDRVWYVEYRGSTYEVSVGQWGSD